MARLPSVVRSRKSLDVPVAMRIFLYADLLSLGMGRLRRPAAGSDPECDSDGGAGPL